MNLNHQDTDLRVTAVEDGGSFTGIAADWTLNRKGWRYEPDAFTASMAQHAARGTMPAMLFYHDTHRPIGRWQTIVPKPDGLHVRGVIATDTRDGAEAYSLIKVGAIRAMSLGCQHLASTYSSTAAPGDRRHEIVSRADLIEISVTPTPANPNAKILRVTSLGGARDIEDIFREAGLSSRKAKAAATAAWRAIDNTPDPDTTSIKQILGDASRSLSRFHGAKK